MSASDNNNPSLPSRVRIKDIRILSAVELSKKLDVWLDGNPFEKIGLMPKMEPDKAWAMEDDAVVSETLMVQPYLHQSPFQRGAKKKAVSIQIKADELRTVIRNLTSRIEYSRSEHDGNTFIIGIEPDNAKEDQSLSPLKILIKDIKVNDLKLENKIHIRLMIDNVMLHDKSLKGPFHFDTWSHSMLEVQILEHYHVRKTKLVGRIRKTVQELLVKSPEEIPLIPFKHNPSISESFSLVLAVQSLSQERPAKERQAYDAMEQASKQVAAVLSSSPLISSVTQGAEFVQNLSSMDSIQNTLSMIMDNVDALSDIHPYAKMAWTILSAIPKAYLNDQSRIQGLQDLLQVVKDNYAFVQEVITQNYNKNLSRQKIIAQIIRQTTECSYFIRDYLSSNGFASRQLKNLTSDVQAKIDKYKETFAALRDQFNKDSELQTEISICYTMNMLTDLTAEYLLNDLAYARGARFDFDKLCLPGTRVEIIDEIIKWVNQTNDNDTASRIYLLTGGAGFGKSTIARTVAQRFKAIGRLGSSFAFNRGRQQTINAESCFSTIALDIADIVPSWKASLVEIIKNDRGLRNSMTIREQFRELLIKTGKNLVMTGPILVVLDALDECPYDISFQDFIEMLVEQTAELPSNICILVTSRPAIGIHEAFHNKPHIMYNNMETINAESTRHDIYKFVQSQLIDVAEKQDNWSDMLTQKAEGLFQWASAACSFIKNESTGLLVHERFKNIITVSSSQLDDLYIYILENAFLHKLNDKITKVRYYKVLDYILSVKEPLPLTALCKLYGGDINEFRAILKPLASLFYGVMSDNNLNVPVQPSHVSFRDFLINKERSKQFYIEMTFQNDNLARGSLTIMNDELHFNMYNLQSSYNQNKNAFIDCSNIVKPHLIYSCRYWADHLSALTDISNLISMFKLWSYNQILFWLEIHSLQYQHVKYAKDSLTKALSLLKSTDEITLNELLEDAYQFITQFAMPISQSAPHIYLSAVQFSPQNSCLMKCYYSKFSTILDPTSRRPGSWPQVQVLITGSSSCECLAFSPDGRQIVSGSHDKAVQLWDAQTGTPIGNPMTGHDHWVTSVAFSPDGKQIISGSRDKTIRLWDTQTGASIGDPLIDHDSWVTSVAFSPDGRQIVSGSHDKTIRLWDAQTGASIGDPLIGHDHWVTSVAFSPDGTQITSGSRDKTIQLWDTQNGTPIGDPLIGHNDWVISVAFSPNGKQIVSGSRDKTIRLWDAQTGTPVVGHLTGHDDVVTSVAFSPDSRQIVSGSRDKTIQVWDAQTGTPIGNPMTGHDHWVTSVAFSPDGRQIVSGSRDKIIRLWDALTDALIGDPLTGHDDVITTGAFSPDAQNGAPIGDALKGHGHWVTSVAFSPDGKQIVSGSRDKTIRLWDAQTGTPIGHPLTGHGDWVTSVAFSSDGKHIVSGSHNAIIQLWDTHTGTPIGNPMTGHDHWVTSVAFSPDGRQIISGSRDKTIRLWDAQTGTPIGNPLIGHDHWVTSVAFSPDGRQIVSGSDDKFIRLWDAQTGAPIGGPLTGHDIWVTAVAFSPDGKQIVSGSRDKTVRLWDPQTGTPIGDTLTGHNHWVTSVAFSPDGRQIVSGSGDESIQLWDAQTGATIGGPLTGYDDWVTSVAFSPDGKQVVSGCCDKTIRLWDAQTCALIGDAWTGHDHKVTSVAVPSNSKQLVSQFDSNTALISNISIMNFPYTNQSHVSPNGWVYGPQGQLLFWLPHWYRIGLYRPSLLHIMGPIYTAKIDMNKFHHGEDWTKCYLGNNQSSL